jgi:hypothetical protein
MTMIVARLKFIRSAFRKFSGKLLMRRRKDQVPNDEIKAIDAWSLTQAPH